MTLECVRQGKDGVYIDLHIVPGSKKEGLDYEEYTKRLRLRISAPAADGRANKAVNDYFSRLFGSSNLVYGYTSRKKTVLIRGRKITDVLDVLEKALT